MGVGGTLTPQQSNSCPKASPICICPTPGLASSTELGSDIQFPRISKKGCIEASPTWKVPQF